MVKQVEELETDTELRGFPMRDVEVLHHGEIGVEELRSVELVAALCAETGGGGREHRIGEAWRIDSVGTARCWSSAEVVSEDESTCAVQRAAIVIGCQIRGSVTVHDRERQTTTREDGSGDLPS